MAVMADAPMLAAARLLEPLAERVGRLEHTTQVLQLQLARLTECVLGQLDSRMRLLEQDVVQLRSAPGSQVAASGPSSPKEEPDELEEEEADGAPGTNPQLNIVVSQQNKEGAVVTVEVRARDTVKELKSKAYHQLSVWNRFTDPDGVDEDSAALPPLSSCRLARKKGEEKKALEDRKRLCQCGLADGEELQLLAAPDARSRAADAQTPSPEGDTDIPEASVEVLPTVRLNLLVAHALGEVNIEAWSSETVLAIKQRAHAQLEVWCRFADACSEEGAASSLPALAQSRLYAAGSGDGTVLPHPVDERSSLARCGLQDGAKLFLRAA